jgi:phage terminase Nu1 subunit (DNA packaging protein)
VSSCERKRRKKTKEMAERERKGISNLTLCYAVLELCQKEKKEKKKTNKMMKGNLVSLNLL